MAIKFKDIKEKVEKSPLTTEELQLITEAEEYIDAEILKYYGSSPYGISIELTIPSFEYSPKQKKGINIKYPRKKLMQDELEMRYKKAGWKITIQYDDGLDGPNRSGPDYWVLTGK